MSKIRTMFLVLLLAQTGVLLQGCAPAIVVGAAATGVAIHHSRRDPSTILQDQSIEMAINQEIRTRDTWRDDSNISVTAYNGQVLLTGQTPSQEVRAELLRLASNAEHVRKVYNGIAIRNPTAYSVRNHDTWLTSKVKARMLGRTDVDASRVLVHTENSWVYLMGLVTPSEAEVATRIASEVKGVTKVVKVFEYIQNDGK